MTTLELKKKIERIKKLERQVKETQAEVENIKNEIKLEMEKEKRDEMDIAGYTIRWKDVSSNKFDSKMFEKAMPELYKVYTRVTVSKRFTITG